ncbi:MAG: hypothetical protein ABI147_06890 [Acidobacteriaceae bacterium]
MAGAQKKVVVRLFGGSAVSGYLPVSGFADGSELALMDLGGTIISFPFIDIKLIAYVRDFNTGDLVDPERMGRRNFPARPRAEGLWLRMTFRDGETLEGLAGLDIAFLDSIVSDRGLFVTPPDPRSNAQRVYVPRSALAGLELLGVVTTAAQRKAAAKPAREPQPWLFGEN